MCLTLREYCVFYIHLHLSWIAGTVVVVAVVVVLVVVVVVVVQLQACQLQRLLLTLVQKTGLIQLCIY